MILLKALKSKSPIENPFSLAIQVQAIEVAVIRHFERRKRIAKGLFISAKAVASLKAGCLAHSLINPA